MPRVWPVLWARAVLWAPLSAHSVAEAHSLLQMQQVVSAALLEESALPLVKLYAQSVPQTAVPILQPQSAFPAFGALEQSLAHRTAPSVMV